MKKGILLILAALFALTFATVGCDDDQNVCEEAGEIIIDAMDDFCDDNADCSACSDPEETDGDGEAAACEGAAETAAQACVDDAAACTQPTIDALELACDMEAAL